MPDLTPITSGAPWYRLDVTDDDRAADDVVAGLRQVMDKAA